MVLMMLSAFVLLRYFFLVSFSCIYVSILFSLLYTESKRLLLDGNFIVAVTNFQEALDIVHVSKEDQESVFAMLAAVLWLGNISFTVVDNENHVEPVADEGKILPEVNVNCIR